MCTTSHFLAPLLPLFHSTFGSFSPPKCHPRGVKEAPKWGVRTPLIHLFYPPYMPQERPFGPPPADHGTESTGPARGRKGPERPPRPSDKATGAGLRPHRETAGNGPEMGQKRAKNGPDTGQRPAPPRVSYKGPRWVLGRVSSHPLECLECQF